MLAVWRPEASVELEDRHILDWVVADQGGGVGLPVADVGHLMVVAPSITWLLVSISPFEVRTMPVPALLAL